MYALGFNHAGEGRKSPVLPDDEDYVAGWNAFTPAPDKIAQPIRTDIFSVTVAVAEGEGYYWTSLPHHQNVTFTQAIEICGSYRFWKCYVFIQPIDKWIEVGAKL